jgi:hypothetical protein
MSSGIPVSTRAGASEKALSDSSARTALHPSSKENAASRHVLLSDGGMSFPLFLEYPHFSASSSQDQAAAEVGADPDGIPLSASDANNANQDIRIFIFLLYRFDLRHTGRLMFCLFEYLFLMIWVIYMFVVSLLFPTAAQFRKDARAECDPAHPVDRRRSRFHGCRLPPYRVRQMSRRLASRARHIPEHQAYILYRIEQRVGCFQFCFDIRRNIVNRFRQLSHFTLQPFDRLLHFIYRGAGGSQRTLRRFQKADQKDT